MQGCGTGQVPGWSWHLPEGPCVKQQWDIQQWVSPKFGVWRLPQSGSFQDQIVVLMLMISWFPCTIKTLKGNLYGCDGIRMMISAQAGSVR